MVGAPRLYQMPPVRLSQPQTPVALAQSSSQDHGPSANGVPPSWPVDLSQEEVDKLIAEVMRYMLFKNYQQPGVPVKREELSQLITKNYKSRGLPNAVIESAQVRFANIFGYEMREIVRSRQAKNSRGQSSSQGPADVKSYILKSTVPEDLRMKFVETKENAGASSLALIVVCIIHIIGEKVPEETLWLHLRRLGIKQDDERHPVFGDIKQSLESVIKQRYIQKEKVSSPEGDSYMYELAEKALDNAVMTKVESFVKKMVKTDVPGLEAPGSV